MALHPGVQRKAQSQIDRVVGVNRLPTFDDIESLPYVAAIVKELLRWQPVTPLGAISSPSHYPTLSSMYVAVVHMSTEDDEYKGYFIPKGSLVFGNAW